MDVLQFPILRAALSACAVIAFARGEIRETAALLGTCVVVSVIVALAGAWERGEFKIEEPKEDRPW